MKGMKSEKLLGAVLLGLSLLGAALAQGVMGQQNDGARVQNSPGMTTLGRMDAQDEYSLLGQVRMGKAPNSRYWVTQSVRTGLASTEKLAATLLVGYRPKSGVLEGFAFPGQHNIDYGCDVVGIVFSVNVARGGVRGEGWPGLPHLCAQLERR